MSKISIITEGIKDLNSIKEKLEKRDVTVNLANSLEEIRKAETEILVCSSDSKKGKDDQELLSLARELKIKKIIMIEGYQEKFSLEKHLGEALLKFKVIEKDNYCLETLISFITDDQKFITGSEQSIILKNLAKKVANTDVTVFINGPTGTGKEVVANFIHDESSRCEKPFVAVNCAAIPENMLEAILFGHEKGSFTGASNANKGIFRAADQGTLLLDEISEMPLSLQAKLLRVLQERKVTPVGSNRDIEINVRIIATTNRNMLKEVKNNKFREDLYYRLNVFPVETHNLSERPDDILPISIALLNRHTENSSLPYINKDAQKILREYSWPGNVRELENVLQRAIVLCEKNIIEEKDIMIDVSKQSNFYNNIQENLSEKKLMQA